MLSGFAGRIAGLSGWRRRGVACAAGALSALAMAPVSFWPLLALTFPMLVLLLDGTSRNRAGLVAAFGIGWWFGFGYLVASLWWIGNALLVQAEVFAWLLPFAVLALPAGLAIYLGLGCVLARLVWPPGALRVLTLAASLTAADWLRGHLFTGFPWNSFGYAFANDLALAQAGSLVGLWGMSLLAVAVLASPVLLLGPPRGRGWVWPCLAGAVLAGLWGWGNWRLDTTSIGDVPGVRLRIMQPDLPQDEKFRYDARDRVVERYIETSESAGGLSGITHLIWPESAFPFFLEHEPEVLARIAGILPPETVLVTGAARWAPPPVPGGYPKIFNSIRALDHEGALVATADKVHLVPFGEYLPFQSMLESIGLQQLTRVRGGFAAAERRTLLAIPGLPPVLPLLCYEAIFPDEVRVADEAGPRPSALLNLSNDAWFGLTPGPYQHYQQARLRSIEQGLPMIRGTNDGISAILDPLGRSIAYLGLGQRGVVDGPLPQALAGTFYNRYGYMIPFFLMLMIFCASLASACRHARSG
ncbi:apolipoprotein N-acyltransferase [Ancylobacter sp. 6x-1]|uniref:Apolipoprotein N-acyltransferase n=1 Tax=Ancylobacter crimeensis TaxID=2579147 RepID=A0ABT0DDI7_9HYPH|nr:apolipoprotein N-acyltransferase [Ancylobacter crimeensis]MCK0198020.1 apolipoprotein N-acyltransferase [Ancylobacter crimeensis]